MPASFLVTGDEVHRIEFEDQSWIDIKRSVTALQVARWLNAGTRNITKVTGRGKGATSTTEQTQDLATILKTKLEALVVAWSEPIPLDVTLLSDVAVNRIFEEFDKLNPTDADSDDELGKSETPSSLTTE